MSIFCTAGTFLLMGGDSFVCEEGRPLHEVGSQLTGQPYLEIFTINRDLNIPEYFTCIIVNLTSNENEDNLKYEVNPKYEDNLK